MATTYASYTTLQQQQESRLDDLLAALEDSGHDRNSSLGLELVSTLARQLRAELSVDRTKGTAFRLTFSEGG